MALTAQEVTAFLQANPGLTDAQIASLANQYGVSAQTLSEATGVPVEQVTQRAEAAGTPLTATGMMTGGTATTQTATQQAATQQPSLLSGIVLAGDSWLSNNGNLSTRLGNFTKENVTNVAVGGTTSSQTLAQLNSFINNGGGFAPGTTLVLNTGGNDFLSGVSRDTTRQNIDSILSTLSSKGVKVVLSGAPNVTNVNDITSSSSDKKLQIDPLYDELAKKYNNVTLVNSMPELLSDSGLRTSDNIHINAEGQQRFANDIIRAVNSTNSPEKILPSDVRAAFESQNLTMDQYNTLARYFGNPMLIDEAVRDPSQPTIKEYVNNGRSGYEFATFAATRAPQFGGQLRTNEQSAQLGKLGALVAPYIGTSAGGIIRGEDGQLAVNGPGGKQIALTPLGDNKYLAGIGNPIFGEGKIRYNAGIEYTLDPATDQLKVSNPSIQAFETTSDGNVLKQVVGFIAPIALNALFPGLGAAIGGTLAAGATAATQIAIGNAIVAGLTTGAITGDVEKGLISAALVGGGSYLTNTGAIGDFMEGAGLGDYAKQFNIPTSATIADGSFFAADAAQLAAQGLSPSAIAQNLTAAGLGPGVAETIAQLAAGGANAAQLQQALTSTPGGMFTANVSDAQFVAADAAQLAQQGLSPAQIEQTLLSSGVDPFIAADAAQLAGQGLNAGSIAQNLTQSGAGLPGGMFTTTTGGAGVAGTAAGAGATGTTAGGTTAGTGLTPGQAIQAGGLLSNIVGGGTPGGGLPGDLIGAGIDFARLAALQREATGLGREMAGEAARIGREAAVPFTPYTVTTGAGVGTVGPGGATAVTSPEMQALRQQQLGLAGQAFGAINPAQAAQTLYGQVESLAAPGRAREQEALLAGLQARGLTGFGQNLPTVGGGVRTVNPLFESLLSAQETARAQQALQAQQFGTQEALRQQALGQGLVSGAQGIDQQALAALNTAATLGQQERALASRNTELAARAGLVGLGLRAPYEQIGLEATARGLTELGGAARGLFGLPTQQGNVPRGIFSQPGNPGFPAPSVFTNPTYTGGFGTGYLFGNQDLGQFF